MVNWSDETPYDASERVEAILSRPSNVVSRTDALRAVQEHIREASRRLSQGGSVADSLGAAQFWLDKVLGDPDGVPF